MADGNKTAQRIVAGAAVCTVAWVLIFLIYFAARPKLFTRMFPHELGEFLAGWSALLAFLWALIAVIFQQRQFSNETAKLAAESAKSRKETANAELEHWLERLGMEIQTLAETCAKCELHKKDEDSELLSDLVGNYQVCANLARGYQYGRLISEVGDGLGEFVKRVEDDWVIDAEEGTFEVLAADVDALKDLIANVAKTIAAGAESSDAPVKTDIDNFQKQIGAASECVDAIQRAYSQLGTS
jgi:hypothetical protein